MDELGDSDSGRASNEFQDDANDSEKLLSFTKCLIPNAVLVEDYATETILTLPHHGADGSIHDYATFFRCLDANLNGLGYGSYGLTSTTLEEVFLTLCNLEEASDMSVEKAKMEVSRKLSNPLQAMESDKRKNWNEAFNNTHDYTSPTLVDGVHLKYKQLRALLVKRRDHSLRDWKSLFCNLFMPCFFIGLAMGMTLIKPFFAPDPILPLSPTIYGRGATSFVSLDNSTDLRLPLMILDELLNRSIRQPSCAEPRYGWKVAKCPIIRGAKHDEDVLLPRFLRTFEGKEWQTRDKAFCGCDSSSNYTGIINQFASLLDEPSATGNGYMYDLRPISNISDYILRTYTKFNEKRFGGFSFHKSQTATQREDIMKVWFDNNGFHSVASYLSAVDEALMKANIKYSGMDPNEYTITTYSHPFHIRSSQIGDQSLMQRAGDTGISLIILVGFLFIPTSFVFYLVRERTEEEKQLQKIFGVGPVLYWFSAILWDMFTVAIAVLLSGCIIFCFQIPIYTNRLNFPGVLCLLFLFGWAMTSLVYLTERFFNEPSIAFMVIYCLALFVGIMTMVMKLLIDVFQWLVCTGSPSTNEDPDVAEERRRVTQESSRFDVLRVVNVSKVFKSMFGKRIAVDQVSFAIPRGECFGLLGVNGAGKTTLFRMLTGQLKPTSGETVINKMHISKLLSSSCQFLGYCPQTDALDGVLTPREHMAIYSEIRGIPSMHIGMVVADSISKFQLSRHADIPVNCLSRGTKRKLCLAIAMVGSPQVVLLDEPTSGMDPMSRRCLWQNIQAAIRDRRSVLLTSHSMEECDILCSRLAIMVNGHFKCIGSPQYLKHKFGAGYTVALRLSEGSSNWNEAIGYMKSSFPSCILRAHHHNMLEFSLPNNDTALSLIFSNLQEAKSNLQLQDFSVSQTTLDQVFVQFADQQVNDHSQEHAPLKEQLSAGFSNIGFVSSTTNLNKPEKVAEKVPEKVKVEQVKRRESINVVIDRKHSQHFQARPLPRRADTKPRQMAPRLEPRIEPRGLGSGKAKVAVKSQWKPCHSHHNTKTTRF
ncbi:Phospholipid-transporting ATPase ABCA1 [Halotydeus destructor]|nr:Phospholipid-transporting ATPase ABCA1 [Halotydeus destructor]